MNAHAEMGQEVRALFREAPAGRALRKRRLTAKAERAKAILEHADAARDDFGNFCQFMMPDADDPGNPTRTGYHMARHHEVLVHALELVERGVINRLIINVPPRHGKTQTATKFFPVWRTGRDPRRSTIIASYNQDFASDIGREVRANIQSRETQLVFPELKLDKSSLSASRLNTTKKGGLFFVGRGGALTGRGGDLLLVDDPIKDAEEAASSTIRETLWNWFNSVFMTRAMHDKVPVVIIQTRWHEDDLTGRLIDPSNPLFNPYEAKRWTVLDMPALCDDPDHDILGRHEGDALWPQRFGREHLESYRARDPISFSALYQCRPAPPDGVFFSSEALKTYTWNELPRNLRIYAASDHAVTADERRDRTCMVLAGMDDKGDLYILPEIYWQAASADQSVEAFLNLIRKHQPLLWWAEAGAISKAIGPFLRRRMQEEQVFCAIHEVPAIGDKWQRAQAIHARTMTGRVLFPSFAPWWSRAREELLKFPQGTHDDFVDAIAHLGRGLLSMAHAPTQRSEDPVQHEGTLKWVKTSGVQPKKLGVKTW